MGRGTSYPPELRERAVRMVTEVRPEYPSDWPAIKAVAGRLGILSELSTGRIAVALAAIVGAVCFYWWAAGPRAYLRDRIIVLTPVFLIAGPGLIGVSELGGGVAVGILSGAVGFSAAALLGVAWSSTRS